MEERASWGRHLEFVITCIGFAVGLGNVWRFPHLAYSNGGGAFLIPYVISVIFLGIPLFCLEILFGQFASLGPITIWKINPLFKGLGYTMIALCSVLSIYYNIVVATAIFFFFASMQETLPWTTCGNDWNTCYCRTKDMNTSLSDPLMWFESAGLNCSGLEFNNSDIVSSSEEYYHNYVLDQTDGIFDLGNVKWDLTLCNLLGWIIICIALIKGVNSMGKAVYFFALFPYVLLTVLLVRGVTLDGASNGIYYYLKPDLDQLKKSTVWKEAAAQIFFSLSCCTGSLTAMASYNKFHNNVLRDSIIIPVINCLTSFYAGFAIFSVIGYMAEQRNIPISEVTNSGPGLVFVVYPEGLSQMPVPQLWSILFFLMMICLGMGTQFPSVETIMTALQDEFSFLRGKWRNIIFRISVCVIGFLLGLPQTTQGGIYLLDLCDIFVGFPLLLVGLFEIIAIVWVYGVRRFKEDVLLMIGHSYLTTILFYAYYLWNWIVVTPVLILAIIIFEAVQYEPIISDEYPDWSEALGWLIVAFIMIWLPAWYIGRYVVELYRGGNSNWIQLFIDMNQPTDEWGPRNPEDRTLPRYQKYMPTTTSKDGKESMEEGPPSYSSLDMSNKNGQENPGFVSDTRL